MTTINPNSSKLRRRIVLLLGKQRQCIEEDIKAAIRAVYLGISPRESDSAVESAILQMQENGLVELGTNDQVLLTESGLRQYEIILSREEARLQKRKEKVARRKRDAGVKLQRNLSRERHSNLKEQLGQLGIVIGMYGWATEYPLVKGGPVILDTVWYASRSSGITHAFEVQNRGDWKNAIGNLEATKRRYGQCKTFLVVSNESEIKPISQLLGARMDESIEVMRATEIEQWLEVLNKTSLKLRSHMLRKVLEASKTADGLSTLRRSWPKTWRRRCDILEAIVKIGLAP